MPIDTNLIYTTYAVNDKNNDSILVEYESFIK